MVKFLIRRILFFAGNVSQGTFAYSWINDESEMSKLPIKLSALAIGKSAVITSFEKDDLHIKLMEMGCVPGETVKVEKIAPLGDPISIMVAGYNLSLRKTEADFIWVEEIG